MHTAAQTPPVPETWLVIKVIGTHLPVCVFIRQTVRLSFYSSSCNACPLFYSLTLIFVCLSAEHGNPLEHSCPRREHLVLLQISAVNIDEVTALII